MIECICENLKRIKLFKCLCVRLKAIKRAKNIKKNRKKIPPYLLTGDYEKELNYKLWTTKGARFAASHRNYILHKLSSQSIGYLSAYLIIIGVVNMYGIKFGYIEIPDNKIAFISTAFSILILLFSQLEGSESFILKSERHHNCSLDIAELYNRLRYNKSFIDNPQLRKNELEKINTEYDRILKKYENHLPIDYLKFQLMKPEYFGLKRLKRYRMRVYIYSVIYFKYHALIFGPIIIFVAINIIKLAS